VIILYRASRRCCLEEVIEIHATELPAKFDIAPGQVHHFSVDFGRDERRLDDPGLVTQLDTRSAHSVLT
jgi:hypothetical protein